MEKLFAVGGPDFLKLRISVSMLRCTYSCEYCVAASGQSQATGVDASRGMGRPDWGAHGREVAKRAIAWAASLPYQVGVRYDAHGEPFLSDDVVQDVAWLTRQQNVSFVEVQTNASMLQKRASDLSRLADPGKLTLFCTFHHSQVSPEDFLENVRCARDLGVNVIVNVLVFHDNVESVRRVLALCAARGILASADIRYPGFTVPLTADGKRARHFLRSDPIQALLDAGPRGEAALGVVADSGPLGKDVRFLAALLVGLYGMPGRQCSAGHDYLFVDKWGDVYRCFCYADIDRKRLGSVLDQGFVPALREAVYAPCQYPGTCHQKEEYGNLRLLRQYRDRRMPSLNNVSGQGLEVDPEQLRAARLAMLHLARHSLSPERPGLVVPGGDRPGHAAT